MILYLPRHSSLYLAMFCSMTKPKNVVKFCLSSPMFVTNILENFQNKDGGGAFLSKARSLSFERFS